MIKYINTQIVFQEIPDEISLAINITQCPNNCLGCHSSYLKDDIGIDLTKKELAKLIEENPGVSCILFMGGDKDRKYLNTLAQFIKCNYNLKVGYYSGLTNFDDLNLNHFNYVKLGPYIKELGGLNNPTTNQRLYMFDNQLNKIDMTNLFWNEKN